MKKVIFHLFSILEFASTARFPKNLYVQSLACIQSNFNKETLKIASRIYPNIFSPWISPEQSGIYNFLYFDIPGNKEIDLSEMYLSKIPIEIGNRMNKIKVLNLSKNFNLKMQHDWFKVFYSNLKDLSLEYCNLSDIDIEIIKNCKSLERLNISGNSNLNLDSESFKEVLKNLIHLNVSNCSLTEKMLLSIFKKGRNLISLILNSNDLSGFFVEKPDIPEAIRLNLRILELSGCKLKFQNLENIFIFRNLEELDVSGNDFSQACSDSIKTVFDTYRAKFEMENFPERTDLQNFSNPKIEISDCLSAGKLKVLKMSYCKIHSKKLFEGLLDMKGLETLYLIGNFLSFSLKDTVNCKAKNSLKKVILSYSGINSIDFLRNITNFENLEILDISSNTFENVPDDFSLGCSKNSLKNVRIGNCKLNYNGLKAFLECSALESLDVSWNNLKNLPTDFQLGAAKNSLKELNVSCCLLNYSDLKLLTSYSKLQILNISFNNFENTPEYFELGNSKNCLTDLDIHNSRINYNCLKALTECCKLERLLLQGNDLRNSVPLTFTFGLMKSSLRHLEVHDCNSSIIFLKAIEECTKLRAFKYF